MFGNHYYHARIRKAVASFGRIFNDIYVIRAKSDGTVLQTIKVPIAYAPRAKYLERIRENQSLENDTKVSIKLPRLSFEITGITYDANRQLPKINSFAQTTPNNSTTQRTKFNISVPYIMNFNLSAYATTQDDALQIVEQILPYFAPQYNITIKPFANHNKIKEDVPLILTGLSLENQYEGDLASRTVIQYSMDFEMHIFFYGPVADQDIITKAEMKYFNMGAGLQDSDLSLERQTITPTALVSGDSDFGFNEVIKLASDSDGEAIAGS
mgnify:CR=1 FL=1|tara:strand:- start:710 stop:1516 length:807 start_codon:yes stop_codon:yes gene_type:complete